MKKILISAILLIGLSTTAFSQVRFGLNGGVNFAKMSMKSSGMSVSFNSLTTFQAGILVDAPLGSELYLQPQLLLTGQGFKSKNILGLGVNETANPFYLKLPVNFLYKIPAGPGKVFAGLGPYLAIGLFGKVKDSGSFEGISANSTSNIKFGSSANNDDLTRIDDGLNFRGGYEFNNGFLIAVNYSLGLKNTQPGTPSDAKRHNYNFGISIGYLFGRNW